MKNFLIILSIIVGLLNTPVHAQEDLFPFIAEVSSHRVNVRAGLNKNFEPLGKLDKGDDVLVVDKSYGWYKIKLPLTAMSYISDEFVLTNNNIDGEIVSERVNVRAGAGINHTVLGQVNTGDKVQILEVLEGWYRIKPVADSYGWIAEDLLTFKSRDIESFQWKNLVQDIPQKKDLKAEDVSMEKDVDREVRISKRRGKVVDNSDSVLEVNKTEIDENLQQDAPAPIVIEPQEDVTLEGKLILSPEKNLKDTAFILVLDDQSIYYVNGLKRLLHNFLGYKLRVNGDVSPETVEAFKYPLMNIQEFQLML